MDAQRLRDNSCKSFRLEMVSYNNSSERYWVVKLLIIWFWKLRYVKYIFLMRTLSREVQNSTIVRVGKLTHFERPWVLHSMLASTISNMLHNYLKDEFLIYLGIFFTPETQDSSVWEMKSKSFSKIVDMCGFRNFHFFWS